MILDPNGSILQGVFTLAFFASAVGILIGLAPASRPGLSTNDEGVITYLPLRGERLYCWEDIVGFNMLKLWPQTYLRIHLRQPEGQRLRPKEFTLRSVLAGMGAKKRTVYVNTSLLDFGTNRILPSTLSGSQVRVLKKKARQG